MFREERNIGLWPMARKTLGLIPQEGLRSQGKDVL